ncbi:MAG TPA: cytochrome oxidase small assembly protein [Rhodanobacteraceae bacterium]
MLQHTKHIDSKHEDADAAMDALARRKAASRRTAWIIAAIAIAFFIASLVHGHYVGIPNWVPTH